MDRKEAPRDAAAENGICHRHADFDLGALGIDELHAIVVLERGHAWSAREIERCDRVLLASQRSYQVPGFESET